ncbi:small ribosomal subunit Rsm22 family protein [Nonomuraea pusilla]|uniref:Ribosomal protein RSM22 (Predicted rRNA methylase) n=1 Tax=Nonomuraea pusilla TaxID=46177 RepID=A0A1H7X007_9ACTN|nr:small ribosomal subunit Rsm22 family protein [Nonomuraea pusilla]SEM26459.1 Ribosomal protein RSM22 (predicted rRNA methylase) [Nonomuraea pusilla]
MLLPDELRTALDSALSRFSPQDLSQAAEQLTERYRAHDPGGAVPFMRTPQDVAAYAAYRMPATYAACTAAMGRAAALAPGFAPRTHLDVGGGTGAAVWAASGVWPSLEQVTVVEQDAKVIELGRRLARTAPSTAVRGASWRQASVRAGLDRPAADLVTMSYALGELPERDVPEVAVWLAERAALVLIVEPGTPAGYATIAAARDALLGRGLAVLAPCPHGGPCPIEPGRDWCHFSVRLPRTSLHRRVKAGTLGFEDEKFSYLAVAGEGAAAGAVPPGARVLRHPGKRKGVVSLRLCTPGDGVRDVIVSKRQGEVYRLARDVEWGDAWSH